LATLGADAFVSPFENNRQNMERTLESVRQGTEKRQNRSLRSLFFVPVFAWPPLFRIRADLGTVYGFNSFSDNQDESFYLITDPEGSTVIPQKPFSITDKIPFLKEAGFKRFIIDLSGPPLKKNNYKDLMQAANNGTPLPRISRFNWKDGFYSPEQKADEPPAGKTSHKGTKLTKFN
jgi:putative protease